MVLLVLVAAGLWLRSRLVASLPRMDGELRLQGLQAPVQVERDALGVPTVRGESRRDVAFATGFLHAQERFFQMDLLRRRSAGELSELVGEAAFKADSRMRVHRLRDRARRALAGSAPDLRRVLEAYSQGVNAGLRSLGAPTFEYLMLRTRPEPWAPEDSYLVLLSMFAQLQGTTGGGEALAAWMRDLLPGPLVGFLLPEGTEWDAPMIGQPFASPPIPGPEVIDLRRSKAAALVRPRTPAPFELDLEPRPLAASNAWAVAGSRTADGGALLADELHLDISIPNLWYRASLVWPAGGGRSHRITGVTLPGAPAMVVGSNSRVAWGFSNSLVDTTDVVLLDIDPRRPDHYLAPGGSRPFQRFTETVTIKGGETRPVEVQWTMWGPVLEDDHRGRRQALRWVAHEEGAVDFEALRLETAQSLEQALRTARSSGFPALNFVAADSAGHVGWTILGRVPRRVGLDGQLPASWADGRRRWEGLLAPEEVPQIVDPASGRVWTANNRLLDGTGLDELGRGGYLFGARARQIRDDLFAVERATVADMRGIQLDNRAVFLARWRDLLLRVLTPESVAADPRRAEMRALVERWGGRAAVDSAGYRLVRTFRIYLARQVFDALVAPCKQEDPEFDFIREADQFEGPLWQIVTRRPMHLLKPEHKSWDDQFLAAADEVTRSLTEDGSALRDHTWGERNTTAIRHPLSRAIPGLGRWLDMPHRQLPGDQDMPRVQHPAHGATLRMVVSPGREEAGIFNMPGGQSGHPLSPHYGDSHGAWEEGAPAPFLPGPAVSRLTLLPPR
ncbi:MAG: penicillin acylase family protein [Acidobacteriota bacterium]